MNFWKNHLTLRAVLITVFFVIGMVLTISGWKMTGKLLGLGIFLAINNPNAPIIVSMAFAANKTTCDAKTYKPIPL